MNTLPATTTTKDNKNADISKKKITKIVHVFGMSYKDHVPWMALLLAAKHGNNDVARMMIQADANVNCQDKSGDTAIMIAAACGHPDIVKILVEAGADVNHQNNAGVTALSKAAMSKQSRSLKILIKAGALVDYENENDKKWTALMYAAINGRATAVKILIDAGANVNHKNIYKQTALMHAASRGHSEIVTTLVKAGANVNYRDECGYTALLLAAEWGHNKSISILVRAGANVSRHKKKSALRFAIKNESIDGIETLIRIPPVDQVWKSMRGIKFTNGSYVKTTVSRIWAQRCVMEFVLIPLLARKPRVKGATIVDDNINPMANLNYSCRRLMEPHALVQIAEYLG